MAMGDGDGDGGELTEAETHDGRYGWRWMGGDGDGESVLSAPSLSAVQWTRITIDATTVMIMITEVPCAIATVA